ncbi:MAG TPA: FHA domain-containing protein [Tepidisphaeraceae bacterium]|nr:FHA domain-containing protein [Tepidisphaeraceae bacterium]
MQVVLVMFKTDGSRRSFSLHKQTTVVGRREDCDVRIPLGEISRKHCKIIREDDELKIEDLGSSNGTYINGQRVQGASLSPGDTIKIGSVVFVVQLDGVPGDDEMTPFTSDNVVAVAGDTSSHDSASHDVGFTGSDGSAPGMDPTAISDVGTSESSHTFDPMGILDGPNDSGAADALSNSAIADDIAADLERAEREDSR